MKTVLQLAGLHCGHCVKSVETALNAVSGVQGVEIDLATQIAQIDGNVTAQTLIDCIEAIGFEAWVKTA